MPFTAASVTNQVANIALGVELPNIMAVIAANTTDTRSETGRPLKANSSRAA